MIRPNVHFLKNHLRLLHLRGTSLPYLVSSLLLFELVNLLHHRVQHQKHNISILNIQIQKLKLVAMIRTFPSGKFSVHIFLQTE